MSGTKSRKGYAAQVAAGVIIAMSSTALAQSGAPSSTSLAWQLPDPVIVIDGYQGNDFSADAIAADKHVKAVIWQTSKGHKNTVSIDDKFDAVFKAAKRNSRFLVGGYHFGYAGNVEKQAKVFAGIIDKYDLKYAALDIDASVKGVDMSPAEGLVFLKYVHDHTKRAVWPQLYTNSSIAANIAKTYGSSSLYSKTTLWVASPTLNLFGPKRPENYWQPTWKSYALWQFSSDKMCVPGKRAEYHTVRPCPYVVPLMDPGLDIQVFNGSADQLKSLFSW